ncbi:hypothetical protein [Litchfieldia alkalitelluris]|uniref:hypothetical protein n=1 Tax=Litchfieldia alkalitelluris TaxID=304268 RepID=UPI001F23219F|nr:hypothetical protein [Litchfieldia alkalitelluris]
MGDIVRFKKREVQKGLFEITGTYEGKTYHYAITNDECDTELFVNKKEVILVCKVGNREDL